uniref:IclR family transcriptional regulator C-terminal domain-containing protein n=1 Tax=Streptomyces ureilyticus TaxID=1775131 RepID=UPI002E28209E|nr:IclR family transcriptional regulator C-terminal domain-containing protein [Streptomyces ureilyticus]
MRTSAGAGHEIDPHCAAAGKVLLAQLPTQRVQQILERGPLPKRTPFTRTGPAALLKHLVAVRKTGYAVDDQESEIGIRGLAVPIPGTPSPTALAIYGPSTGIPLPNARDGEPDLISVLRQAAAHISRSATTPST